MGKSNRGLAMALAMLAVVVGGPTGLRPAAANSGREAEIVTRLNDLRADRGVRQLVVREDLASVARAWSARMLRAGRISHNPDLPAQAPRDWSRLGENVAQGRSVQEVHDAFMGSRTHYAQMVDGGFDAVGVGVAASSDGRLFVTVDFMTGNGVRGASYTPPPEDPGTSPAGASSGYRLAGSDGGVYGFGGAVFHGSAARLSRPVVGLAATPSRNGYWLVASDGGVFGFGDARFLGSTGAMALNRPIVGMASSPSGNGYWLVASDGGVFGFGDARFLGSTGAMALNRPIVGMAPTPSGNGYRLVASDGGIFGFGDGRFHGSTGAMALNRPIVGMAATPSGNGYWLVASDGGIFGFGDARFQGSTAGTRIGGPIVGMAA